MRYKPSIAFDRMSGSAKGVTASSNKGAIFIRTRGHGTKKRTADQSVIKSIFRLLTPMLLAAALVLGELEC